MKTILVTGATGNIGIELIESLLDNDEQVRIIAAVRNIKAAKKKFPTLAKIEYCHFDFESIDSYKNIPGEVNTVFLLRPPQLSDVKKYFFSLINILKEKKTQDILFLSVQGADRNKFIPHHKIEKLIKSSGINYIFLRPSYFMQNITTTLYKEIYEEKEIFIPAGNAKFNWIDTKNIGEVAAELLIQFDKYKNKAFDLTGKENLDFNEVKEIINSELSVNIRYKSPDLLSFYNKKRRDKMNPGMILVMIFLHYFPRYGKEPQISNFYEEITGKKTTSVKEFIHRESRLLSGK